MGFQIKRLLRTKIKTAVWPLGLSGIILPDVNNDVQIIYNIKNLYL